MKVWAWGISTIIEKSESISFLMVVVVFFV